jgi:hypothetical protein
MDEKLNDQDPTPKEGEEQNDMPQTSDNEQENDQGESEQE